MNKLFFILFSCITLASSAQDLKTTLQSGKWYAQGYVAKEKIVFTKKPISKKQVATAEFKTNGKIKYCDLTEETYFDANGNEKKDTPKFYCDTVEAYVIKNDLIHIYWNNVKHWYYKATIKNENVELNPIKPEEFNKE